MRVRLGQPGPYGLRASLLLDGDSLPADLVGVSFAALELLAPPLPIRDGDAIVVGLMADGMVDLARVGVIVRGVTTLQGAIRIEVQVLDPERLTAMLPARTQSAFNRRGAFRVIPDTRQPLNCVFRREEGPITLAAPVISVSVTGMGMFVKGADPGLQPGDRLIAELKVPGTSKRVTVVANVRYEMPMLAGTRFGVMFDSRESPYFARQQKALSQYIMALQRRMLRMSDD